MLRNFFQIAWRQLQKRKFYTLINVTGLAIGMACCLVITLYVKHELSYDRYHANSDRIYRVLQTFRSIPDGQKAPPPTPQDFQFWGNAPVGPALQSDFPQIEKVVRFMSPSSWLMQVGDKRIQQGNMTFIDSTAFDVFTWKMIYGDPHTALNEPNSIVLTQSVVQKLFGDTNPVGKAVHINNQVDWTVTGVMQDIPSNTQFNFNGFISMATMRKSRPDMFGWWGYVDFYTYILLKSGANINGIQAKVPAFIKSHDGQDAGYAVSFEKMTDAYLHSVASRQPGPTGSMLNVYLFSCIALFILLIACINFMNLATARSLERAKEVGVRKVLGVTPRTLMGQFLFESILLTLSAMVIALVLARYGVGLISHLAGKDFVDTEFFTPLRLLIMVGFALVVGLMAGLYPAWFISGFKPIAVLKGKFRPSGGGVSLRKALVVFQFSMSITLIAATAIVYTQMRFVSHKDLGFKKDQMIVINFEGDDKVEKGINMVKSAIAADPGVTSVAASRAVPGEFLPNAGTAIEGPDKQMVDKIPFIYEIDFDFIPTYHIEMAAGRNYSRAFTTDSAQSMVINEAAAKLWGYDKPADAIGKKFDQWGRKGTIIGVVKDFNFRSLHQQVEPLTLRYGYPDVLNFISVTISPDNIPGTIAAIKSTWEKVAPQTIFEYRFLDESFGAQYQADQNFGNLFTLFAILAIGIACLGLFGLSTFMAQQRVKEIGIRKVLGSSEAAIVMLLSKEFIKLVGLAAALAIPICWWAMGQWLQGFAYRITIGPVVFLEAAAISLGVAVLTIGWQSLKAAMANPIESLRNE
jgi:putative ABC transport system permease protein